MASITVISPGFYSSIQDKGRYNYAHFGIPESGAMDKEALELGNHLLNNPLKAAGLEYTLIGPVIRFDSDVHFVLTGASTHAEISGVVVEMEQVAFAKAGTVLNLQKIECGTRGYLTVDGGVENEKIFGSRSMYAPITKRTIAKGDQIVLGQSNYGGKKGARLRIKKPKPNTLHSVLKITAFKGPEFQFLDEGNVKLLLERKHHISKNWNRMAVQLEEPLSNKLSTIRTVPVVPGTVQLTPSGKLIILHRDCQTTGGYPRVLQLSEAGLNVLAQLKQNDSFQFELL